MLNIEINEKLLKETIATELLELLSKPWESSTMAIGKYKGVQFQLCVTKNRDDFCSYTDASKIIKVKP